MRDEVTVVIMCPEGAGILSVSLYEHRCRGLAETRLYCRSYRTAAQWKHDCQEQNMPAPLTPQTAWKKICILVHIQTPKPYAVEKRHKIVKGIFHFEINF